MTQVERRVSVQTAFRKYRQLEPQGSRTQAVLGSTPREGRRTGTAVCAPWRGLRRWFGCDASFVSRAYYALEALQNLSQAFLIEPCATDWPLTLVVWICGFTFPPNPTLEQPC